MTFKRFDSRVLLSPPHMGGEEKKFIDRAFTENWIVPLGPNVAEFEKNMIRYLEKENLYAVAMTSGTAAIHIALKLLNVQPGEEIFCSSATFIATANPILYEKAVPVFVDSEMKTWNICPESLLKAIEAKKRTGKIPRILISVDLFGMSAEYEQIEAICKQYNIQIIEDSAEALGSSYKGKKCGTFGKYGILSFNGNKIITTSGGGMLLLHSKEEAEKAVFLITQARDNAPYYLHSEIGYNYRLSNICAGIGIGQLNVLDQRVKSRRANFAHYQEALKSTPLSFTDDPQDFFSNHWLTTALIDPKSNKRPTDLINLLESYNIEVRHVWKPLHTQPVFKDNEFFTVHAKPIAERIFNEGICLPSGTKLDPETLNAICQIIKSAF
ncbi:MAG: aminotransferase class I/II-fold pyridoxal phosphate-dependent enzyme [Bacteriovorax sp.]|jgi:pyridoxal phosphate-dependent aminotransferase EpsN